jgi:hypothetical protein
MFSPCFECRHANHDACWGVCCGCFHCMAEDKDEFNPLKEAA